MAEPTGSSRKAVRRPSAPAATTTIEAGGRRETIAARLHVCQVYSQPGEPIQTAAPLLRDGLRSRERCLVAASPARVEAVRAALRAAHVDVEVAVAADQLTFVVERADLLRDGRLDPYHLLSGHQTYIRRSLDAGWPAVRLVVDMTWLAGGAATVEQILKYEAAADAVFTFQQQPITALIQYSAAAVPGEVVVELIKLHPVMVVGRHINRNPYYVHSERYLHQLFQRSRRGQAAPQ
jgi:hypothetical protein